MPQSCKRQKHLVFTTGNQLNSRLQNPTPFTSYQINKLQLWGELALQFPTAWSPDLVFLFGRYGNSVQNRPTGTDIQQRRTFRTRFQTLQNHLCKELTGLHIATFSTPGPYSYVLLQAMSWQNLDGSLSPWWCSWLGKIYDLRTISFLFRKRYQTQSAITER